MQNTKFLRRMPRGPDPASSASSDIYDIDLSVVDHIVQDALFVLEQNYNRYSINSRNKNNNHSSRSNRSNNESPPSAATGENGTSISPGLEESPKQGGNVDGWDLLSGTVAHSSKEDGPIHDDSVNDNENDQSHRSVNSSSSASVFRFLSPSPIKSSNPTNHISDLDSEININSNLSPNGQETSVLDSPSMHSGRHDELNVPAHSHRRLATHTASPSKGELERRYDISAPSTPSRTPLAVLDNTATPSSTTSNTSTDNSTAISNANGGLRTCASHALFPSRSPSKENMNTYSAPSSPVRHHTLSQHQVGKDGANSDSSSNSNMHIEANSRESTTMTKARSGARSSAKGKCLFAIQYGSQKEVDAVIGPYLDSKFKDDPYCLYNKRLQLGLSRRGDSVLATSSKPGEASTDIGVKDDDKVMGDIEDDPLGDYSCDVIMSRARALEVFQRNKIADAKAYRSSIAALIREAQQQTSLI